MNVLIDLEKCREYLTISINKKNFNIRLAGTINDPYFCGKDLCEMLGYSDLKEAIKKFVDDEDKISLSELNNDKVKLEPFLGGALCPPQTWLNWNHKLGKEKFSFREGQMVFISETGLYSLILSSQTPFAKEFKKLVCKDILPSIRKYGSFQLETQLSLAMEQLTIKDEQLTIKDEQLTIKDNDVEKLENQLRQQQLLREESERKAKEKLERALKFNQATKQVEPQEYIYVVTTNEYMTENKFKVGGCSSFDLVKSRLSQYNSGKSESSEHFFVYLKKVVSYRVVEQTLFAVIGRFREAINKELYIINYDWLIKCLTVVIDHNMDFLSFVNLNREQMVHDTINKDPVVVVPLCLEKIKILYQRIGEEEVELTTILDQDTINAVRDAIRGYNPDNNVVKRVAFENHLIQHYPKVIINHKKRIIWDMVKKIGVSLNPLWRYKY